MLALVDHELRAVGAQGGVVGDGLDEVAEKGVQLGGQEEAEEIDGEDVGEAAAFDQEVAVGQHVGQHVEQVRQEAEGEEEGGEEEGVEG